MPPTPTSAAPTRPTPCSSVSEENVSRLSASGFGGGTIYYPRENNTYGAVAISPGYTGTEASIAWLGERIASHGFVVITIDTITTLDQPDSRAEQLNAALNHMINRASSTVRSRIDSSRLAVMGHSMGGGGTLRLASQRPDLKAAIPLTPWHLNKNWSSVTVPTLIIGADLDTIAPVATHAKPFYNSLPSSISKAYLELDGATHFAPNIPNKTLRRGRRVPLHLPVLGREHDESFLPILSVAVTAVAATGRFVPPFHSKNATNHPFCPIAPPIPNEVRVQHWWFYGCMITVTCPIVATQSR